MASVVKRTVGKGKTARTSWFVKYRDGNRKQHLEHVGTGNYGRAAAARAAELTKLIHDSGGTYVAPDRTTTVEEYVLAWIDEAELRETTALNYRRLLKADNGFLARWGHLKLAALRRQHVRTFMAERAKAGASSLTIRNAIAPVRAALSVAVEDGLLSDNPAALPRRQGQKSAVPGREPRQMVIPEPATVAKVIEAAEGPFRLVLQLSASCGLRRGETFGLKWGDFSQDMRTVKVQRSNDAGKLVATKTRSSVREVPVFPTVRRELLEHRLRSVATGPDDLVFPDPVGQPQNPGTTVTRELAAAFKKAGVGEKAFRLHDLRHFACSALIRAGMDVREVSRVAGHKSPVITLKVYTHLFEGDVARAADRFDPVAQETAAGGRW